MGNAGQGKKGGAEAAVRCNQRLVWLIARELAPKDATGRGSPRVDPSVARGARIAVHRGIIMPEFAPSAYGAGKAAGDQSAFWCSQAIMPRSSSPTSSLGCAAAR